MNPVQIYIVWYFYMKQWHNAPTEIFQVSEVWIGLAQCGGRVSQDKHKIAKALATV